MAHKNSLKLCALVVHNGASICSVNPSNTLLVIGNESQGIPQEYLSQCDTLITLPMPGGTESLNAAVAGSIATYMVFGSGLDKQ